MFPAVVHLGSVTVYSYGVMLFLSFVLGVEIVRRRSRSIGVDSRTINRLALWILAAILIGSRVLYVAFHWSEFRGDLIGTVALWRGGLAGLVFNGGFVTAVVAGLVFFRVHRLPALKMLDFFAPAVALGEGLTRIGCFLNGCCFGRPTDSFLGVVFPPGCPAGAAFPGQPIHPTQLYSSLAGFALFGMVLILERLRLPDGSVFATLLIPYSLFRFAIDFVRHHTTGADFWGNQIIAAGTAVVGVVMLITIGRRRSGGDPTRDVGP